MNANANQTCSWLSIKELFLNTVVLSNAKVGKKSAVEDNGGVSQKMDCVCVLSAFTYSSQSSFTAEGSSKQTLNVLFRTSKQFTVSMDCFRCSFSSALVIHRIVLLLSALHWREIITWLSNTLGIGKAFVCMIKVHIEFSYTNVLKQWYVILKRFQF